jgi:nucleoside-diphosphate-sugar epimerase
MIVITGASGFIGRHLFHELTALNTLVKGFSRTNKQFLLVKNYSDIIVDEPSILIHLAQTSAINSHIDNYLKKNGKKSSIYQVQVYTV